MNNRFKFRVRYSSSKKIIEDFVIYDNKIFKDSRSFEDYIPLNEESYIIEQCTGLKDKENELYFKGDVGQFDNGDTFFIDCEDWLEFFVEWTGKVECEDQARDFYRIRNAKIIGTIHDEEPK